MWRGKRQNPRRDSKITLPRNVSSEDSGNVFLRLRRHAGGPPALHRHRLHSYEHMRFRTSER